MEMRICKHCGITNYSSVEESNWTCYNCNSIVPKHNENMLSCFFCDDIMVWLDSRTMLCPSCGWIYKAGGQK